MQRLARMQLTEEMARIQQSKATLEAKLDEMKAHLDDIKGTASNKFKVAFKNSKYTSRADALTKVNAAISAKQVHSYLSAACCYSSCATLLVHLII